MDENVSAKVSPMYVGIFVTCGILGELSCHDNAWLTRIDRLFVIEESSLPILQ